MQFVTPTVLALASLAVGPAAFADQEVTIPDAEQLNVIVVKVELDAAQQEIQDKAFIMPLKIKFVELADGSVDLDALILASEEQLESAEQVSLVAYDGDGSDLPQSVRDLFDAEDAHDRQLTWRFYSPWGSIGNSGFYGYGNRWGWGYNSGYNYYPSYGYYYGGRNYPYRYGGYRHHNNYGYSYYYNRNW
jgi:hypothetical protein